MNPLTASQEPMPGLAARKGAGPASLVDLMLARCGDAFDKPACIEALGGGATLTWGEVFGEALALADAFEATGLRRGDRLAHVGPHSIDWVLVDLACLLSGIVHVALHADASARDQTEQLAWLAPRGIAMSGGRRCDVSPGLITIDVRNVRERRGAAAAAAGVREAVGRRAAACDPDAPATILMSSGTTGLPKGVIHCQRALVANAVAAADVFLDEAHDVRLSWLPMSHALARVGDLYTALVRGGCLSVVADRARVLDACRMAAPTVILGVPVFFERLERGARTGRIADLAAALGGRVRVCVSGGAALRRRTAEFFARQGVPLVEGYGLAEAGPVVALSNPRITRPGAVGRPLAGVDVQIDARHESRGQVLVRTPCRALAVIEPALDSGAQETAVDRSAWLETGDLGVLDADGQLRITGRLADAIVLASGVKVPPSEVEATIAEDEAVAQVCVIGNGCPWPVALVVPDPGVLRAAIRRMGVRVLSKQAALRHPRVRVWLERRLARRQGSLPKPWRARRVVLVGRPFDAAHGEATESLKLKRPAITSHFQWALDAVDHNSQSAVAARAPHAGTAPWLTTSLWHGVGDDGFAAAAQSAIAPLRDAVAGVLDAAENVIGDFRKSGRLYEPLPGVDPRRPPIDDAPASPRGLFSTAVEEALGDVGLWGLPVPEAFGGSGCTMEELAQAITRIAANVPTAAGMLSLHASIGAVTALVAFGTPEQQARHLPGLAQGRPLSIFGGTEPDAGCDLGAAAARIDGVDGRLVLTGTKMFITGATYGRLVKVLGKRDGAACVVLVRLPEADTASFRLVGYPLHPLKHAHNNALVFDRFEIDERDILEPPSAPGKHPDAMKIVWHGLNRGRVTLAAQAAGTLRILLDQAARYALDRRTWGEPIGKRELVQGRLGRLAASVIACDALAAWAAAAIDAGQTGELEAITAKVLASQCVREGAIDALGVHGGRAFLVGHPLGDSFHDHFAATIYEGESDLLGLALFKGICKHHPLAGAVARRAWQWLAWRLHGLVRPARRDGRMILDRGLCGHAARARRLLGGLAVRIDRAVRTQGRALADRQLFAGSLAAEARDLVSVLAVAYRGDMLGDERSLLAADCWCRMALARATGHRLTAADHTRIALLGRVTLPK